MPRCSVINISSSDSSDSEMQSCSGSSVSSESSYKSVLSCCHKLIHPDSSQSIGTIKKKHNRASKCQDELANEVVVTDLMEKVADLKKELMKKNKELQKSKAVIEEFKANTGAMHIHLKEKSGAIHKLLKKLKEVPDPVSKEMWHVVIQAVEAARKKDVKNVVHFTNQIKLILCELLSMTPKELFQETCGFDYTKAADFNYKNIEFQKFLEKLIGSLNNLAKMQSRPMHEEPLTGCLIDALRCANETVHLSYQLSGYFPSMSLNYPKSYDEAFVQRMKDDMDNVLKALGNKRSERPVTANQAKDIAEKIMTELDDFKKQLATVYAALITEEDPSESVLSTNVSSSKDVRPECDISFDVNHSKSFTVKQRIEDIKMKLDLLSAAKAKQLINTKLEPISSCQGFSELRGMETPKIPAREILENNSSLNVQHAYSEGNEYQSGCRQLKLGRETFETEMASTLIKETDIKDFGREMVEACLKTDGSQIQGSFDTDFPSRRRKRLDNSDINQNYVMIECENHEKELQCHSHNSINPFVETPEIPQELYGDVRSRVAILEQEECDKANGKSNFNDDLLYWESSGESSHFPLSNVSQKEEVPACELYKQNTNSSHVLNKNYLSHSPMVDLNASDKKKESAVEKLQNEIVAKNDLIAKLQEDMKNIQNLLHTRDVAVKNVNVQLDQLQKNASIFITSPTNLGRTSDVCSNQADVYSLLNDRIVKLGQTIHRMSAIHKFSNLIKSIVISNLRAKLECRDNRIEKLKIDSCTQTESFSFIGLLDHVQNASDTVSRPGVYPELTSVIFPSTKQSMPAENSECLLAFPKNLETRSELNNLSEVQSLNTPEKTVLKWPSLLRSTSTPSKKIAKHTSSVFKKKAPRMISLSSKRVSQLQRKLERNAAIISELKKMKTQYEQEILQFNFLIKDQSKRMEESNLVEASSSSLSGTEASVERDKLCDIIMELENKANTHYSTIQQLQQDYNHAVESIKVLGSTNKELEDRLNDKECTLKSLKREKELLETCAKEEVNRQCEESVHNNELIAGLRQEILQSQEENKNFKDHITELKLSLKDVEKIKSKLCERLKHKSECVEKLKADLQNANRKVSCLEISLAEQLECANKFESELLEKKLLVDRLHYDLDCKRDSIEQLQLQVEQKASSLKKLEEECTMKTNAVVALELELENFKGAVRQLENDLKHTTNREVDLSKQIQELNSLLQHKINISDHQKAILAKDEVISNLNNKLKEKELLLNEMYGERKSTESCMEKIEAHAQEKEKALVLLKSELDLKEKLVENLKATILEKNNSIKRLETDVAAKLSDLTLKIKEKTHIMNDRVKLPIKKSCFTEQLENGWESIEKEHSSVEACQQGRDGQPVSAGELQFNANNEDQEMYCLQCISSNNLSGLSSSENSVSSHVLNLRKPYMLLTTPERDAPGNTTPIVSTEKEIKDNELSKMNNVSKDNTLNDLHRQFFDAGNLRTVDINRTVPEVRSSAGLFRQFQEMENERCVTAHSKSKHANPCEHTEFKTSPSDEAYHEVPEIENRSIPYVKVDCGCQIMCENHRRMILTLDKKGYSSVENIPLWKTSELSACPEIGLDKKGRNSPEAIPVKDVEQLNKRSIKNFGKGKDQCDTVTSPFSKDAPNDFEHWLNEKKKLYFSSLELGKYHLANSPNRQTFRRHCLSLESKEKQPPIMTNTDPKKKTAGFREFGSDSLTLFVIGMLNNFELLKKEIEECLINSKNVSSRADDGVQKMNSRTTPKRFLEYSTLKSILDSSRFIELCLSKAERLLDTFEIVSLPLELDQCQHFVSAQSRLRDSSRMELKIN